MPFFSFIVGVILSNVSFVWYHSVYLGLCGIELPCVEEQKIAITIELFKSFIDIVIMSLFFVSSELEDGYPKIGIPFVIMFFFGSLIGGIQFFLYYVSLGLWELLIWISFSIVIGFIIRFWVERINRKVASSFN